MNDIEQTSLLVVYALIACVVTLGIYVVVAAGGTFWAYATATVAGAVCAAAFAFGFDRLARRLSRSAADESVSHAKQTAPSTACMLAFLGVAAVANAVVVICALGADAVPAVGDRLAIPVDSPVALMAIIAVYYVATGVLEEALFRGVFMRACIAALCSRAAKRPVCVGVAVSAAVFAIIHAGGAAPASAPEVAQLVLKVVSAFEFGVITAALYIKTSSLVAVICAHALFDIIANGALDFACAGVSSTYATGTWYDIAAIVIMVVVLAAPCIRALKTL